MLIGLAEQGGKLVAAGGKTEAAVSGEQGQANEQGEEQDHPAVEAGRAFELEGYF